MIITSYRTQHPNNGAEIWKRLFPTMAEAQAWADWAIGRIDNNDRTVTYIDLFDSETLTSQDYYLQGVED